MPTKDGKRLKEQVVGAADEVEEDEFGSDEWEVVSLGSVLLSLGLYALCCFCSCATFLVQILLIDPGQFRVLTDLLQKETKGKGRMETLNFATVQGEGEV